VTAPSTLDPLRPWNFFAEQERSADGAIATVNTIFLTNRQCPWRCVMCDLWKNTLPESVPAGAIPAQIEYALARLPAAPAIKLYNSGSFFDPRAIPVTDHPAIARLLAGFERVIVECHPALIGEDCFRFQDSLRGRLEVAMGLETAHPEVLRKLNKGMTLDQFFAAASLLRSHAIDLRAFILVKPPFMDAPDAVHWAERSLDFAFDCDATAASLIPTRGIDAPPSIAMLEASHEYGLHLGRGRVFADLWDLDRFSVCSHCYDARRDRLREMNWTQTILRRVECAVCGAPA
jgi:radical SAM enzyme (TIGR01210 family)